MEKRGASGLSVVYKAQYTRLRRFVALKFLPDDFADNQQLRERFRREARTASALNHPNICIIYDISEAGPSLHRHGILHGTTLKDLVWGFPVGTDSPGRHRGSVLDGLEAAHAQNVIHQDIKPAN